MGCRGLETRLPEGVRQWLEGELIRRGFADYSEATEELARRLAEVGVEPCLAQRCASIRQQN